MNLRESIRRANIQAGPAGGLPSARFRFSAGFPGFDGHFPGQPVLPGVCMLQAAVVALEDWHGQTIRVEEVRRARFLSPLAPGQVLIVQCLRQEKTPRGHAAHLTLRGEGDRQTSECQLVYHLTGPLAP